MSLVIVDIGQSCKLKGPWRPAGRKFLSQFPLIRLYIVPKTIQGMAAFHRFSFDFFLYLILVLICYVLVRRNRVLEFEPEESITNIF